MKVAVQGCSHGCLSQIYDSIARYESQKNEKVDLLLLCGDFQALRSKHDFASLNVPQKYRALGSFHEYYSGTRTAPVLTIVIGGNHEASNYMWELFHGGWLAPNIYYLGSAGCIRVDGLRIVGASGIYNDRNYNKGYFETVPYNPSTIRSVYHIRKYAIERLKMLPVEDHTIALSHDWPTTIAQHGDKNELLKRKPFFKKEVDDGTLGSPPLLDLLQTLQAEYWFSAHLHVKFAAVYDHDSTQRVQPILPVADAIAQAVESVKSSNDLSNPTQLRVASASNPDEIAIEDDFDDLPGENTKAISANPDEIAIDDDFDNVPAEPPKAAASASANPDEITIDDDFDDFDEPTKKEEEIVYPRKVSPEEAAEAVKMEESVDLVEQARKSGDEKAAEGVIGTSAAVTLQPVDKKRTKTRPTKFLALDKCGPGREFIQYLDIPTPPSSSPPASPERNEQPRITFDRHWLAITRALHPYLSLQMSSMPLPSREPLDEMVRVELEKIETQGLLVPARPGQEGDERGLVWEKGDIDIGRVQQFWPTAPAQGQPGGSETAWYTNPQTEAFCGMLGVPNRINPTPNT